MAKREHGAPGRYAIIAALLCIALGALTACGRKEELTETQLGIDGYVYVPRLLDTSAVDTYGNTFMKVHSLKVLGNNLYYYHAAESGGSLERLSLPEESAMPGVQGMDFNAGERLLELLGGYCEETEEMLEEWNRDPGLLIDRMMGKGEWLSGQISLQGHSYSGYVMDYTVDEEDNIYFTFSMGRYDGLEMVESRELLCRYGADGQLCYRMPLDGAKVNGMVPYGSGSLLLLAENEILSLYMEGSRTVRREDFLDGVLEGYTIGGSLVCVPTRFGLNTIVGRDSQTGLLEGWGIEDVYTLMESHPEMTELVSSGSRRLDGPEGGRAEGKGRDYMLKEFLPAYYLERFVDWEAGECSFDSGEFRELLLWLEGHVEKERPRTAIGVTIWESDYVPEYALLMEAGGVEFDDLLRIEIQIGGKVRFLGFPTADGRGTAACRVMDKLGMVSHSLHKEGAWDFLEYFISRGAEDSYYLPTQISSLRDMAEKAADPQPGMLTDHYSVRIGIGDDVHEMDEFPQYLTDALMEQIEGMDFRPRSAAEEQIIEIVAEEADIYYKGDKSLEDVTAVIQNRVELLLKETH